MYYVLPCEKGELPSNKHFAIKSGRKGVQSLHSGVMSVCILFKIIDILQEKFINSKFISLAVLKYTGKVLYKDLKHTPTEQMSHRDVIHLLWIQWFTAHEHGHIAALGIVIIEVYVA